MSYLAIAKAFQATVKANKELEEAKAAHRKETSPLYTTVTEPVTCHSCGWTIEYAINMGEVGKPRWYCHDCCRRDVLRLERLEKALGRNG